MVSSSPGRFPQASLSAESCFHEWACFACHQAVEIIAAGPSSAHWSAGCGFGLCWSYRDLPVETLVQLAAAVPDLEEGLQIIFAPLYRNPFSLQLLQMGAH